jgi:ABC-2 type transport system permease protein
MKLEIFRKNKTLYSIIITVLIILLVNWISQIIFFRIDLTSEKKYSLSKQTKTILKELKEPILIKIYLEGELPIAFKKLNNSIQDMLDEFQAYAGSNIQYKFINPYDIIDRKERNKLFSSLVEKGLKPVNINAKDKDGGNIQKIIFPGAIINYIEKEISINILDNNPGLSAEENLNSSRENLEYKFINAIYQIKLKEKPAIAFIEGHDELDEYSVDDITQELSKYYKIDRVKINGINHILDPYKLIIIAKPKSRFPEKDKFVIDQYIMNGGKVIWLIEETDAEFDNLSENGSIIAQMRETNLEDQLFRYGIRINPFIVEDKQCLIIPVNNSLPGYNSNFVPAMWPYSPLLAGQQNHPVSRNLNLIKSEFANNIDTVGENKNIKHTVLLKTSSKSRCRQIPIQINLSEAINATPIQAYNKSNLIIAILSEGNFESVFNNRIIDNFIDSSTKFISISKPTAMIFISDGDIIKNNIRFYNQKILIEPLGYDRYSNQTFGNKEFLLNAVDYLINPSGLINLRSRVLKIRLLDKQKIQINKINIQLINTVFPSVVIIIIGLGWFFIRKRKYTR